MLPIDIQICSTKLFQFSLFFYSLFSLISVYAYRETNIFTLHGVILCAVICENAQEAGIYK